MESKLEKRYGLSTAISMVVGIVIGSGVFFKAVKVLNLTGGSMGKSLLVIAIVGLIMIICSCVFATMGTKYSKCNGIVDYAEVSLGPKFAYDMGWFMSVLYYPILSATLAWVSARYTCMLLGLEVGTGATCAIGAFYLMLGITINALSPKLAGKMQVSMTVIKLVPLCLMGVVGVIVGLVNGNGISIFSDTSVAAPASSGGIVAGICAFAFAYEGWIIATSINSELKQPKKDLPKALIGGALFCTLIYCLYVYSMSASMNASEIIAAGDWLPKIAFANVFGNAAGTIVFVFIIISCLGTMNGLIMGCMRGLYSVAVRGQGPKADVVAEVDKSTGMPLKSCLIGMVLCAFWYMQWQVFFWGGPLVTNTTGNPAWLLGWEGDEIVIITQYALYIPIFIHLIVREKDFSFFQRFVLPVLGVGACLFMCYCCVRSYGILTVSYLVVFFIFMGVGRMFYKKSKAEVLE
jgi:APA family basic amino acid/polyamine antiporter